MLRVQNDSLRHPHIFLRDNKTGREDTLPVGIASAPRWSPDGKYVACVGWQSPQRPYVLRVVEVAARRLLPISINASTTRFLWSPDSRCLAGHGLDPKDGHGVLYCIKFPGLEARVFDTVSVSSDYEYSWSPDSRWLAASRATRLMPDEEDVCQAELWLFSADGAMKCPLLRGRGRVERNPQWVDLATLQVDRRSWDGKNFGNEERATLELASRDRKRSARKNSSPNY